MGSEAYNLALSEKRAVSVKEAILDAMSPDARSVWSPLFKIVAKGYAVSLPGNTNRTIEERVKTVGLKSISRLAVLWNIHRVAQAL